MLTIFAFPCQVHFSKLNFKSSFFGSFFQDHFLSFDLLFFFSLLFTFSSLLLSLILILPLYSTFLSLCSLNLALHFVKCLLPKILESNAATCHSSNWSRSCQSNHNGLRLPPYMLPWLFARISLLIWPFLDIFSFILAQYLLVCSFTYGRILIFFFIMVCLLVHLLLESRRIFL